MRKMKKALATVLAATMVMGMSSTAWAVDATVSPSDPTTYSEAVIKKYNVINVEGSTIQYPAEQLKFQVSEIDGPVADLPDVTVDDLTINSATGNKLQINIPSYSKVGTYHYKIVEKAGNSQGVTYPSAPDNEINISVLVTYNEDHTKLVSTVGVTKDNNGNKKSELENTYKLGKLEIHKEVTGNLADRDKYFKMNVTFTAETGKKVNQTISIDGGSYTQNPREVVFGNEENTVTTAVWMHHDETITFKNIPDGVSYTVSEDAQHFTGDKNGDEAYTVTYTADDDADSVITKEENVETVNGKIQAVENTADVDRVNITNTKGAEVDTGITLDSLPYIMILAVAALGMVGFVAKKRKEEEMF